MKKLDRVVEIIRGWSDEELQTCKKSLQVEPNRI